MNTPSPKLIFIIPYRDRKEHKVFFQNYMKIVLEDYDPNDYMFYFVHQCDNRPFNRGAMKNIGFLATSRMYPNDYKDITFVFNDVDTIPYDKGVLNYETVDGVVKHFYGVKFALGGIFSIKGKDFEKTSGFPNFWAWGGEDNYMQHRCLSLGLRIDRSNFFPLQSPKILQMVEGLMRTISRTEAEMAFYKNTQDGINTIRNLSFILDNEYINVMQFDTLYDHKSYTFEQQNIQQENTIRFKTKGIRAAVNDELLRQQQPQQQQQPQRPQRQQQQRQQKGVIVRQNHSNNIPTIPLFFKNRFF